MNSIIICALLTLAVGVPFVFSEQCSPSSKPIGESLSDAAFWKGVDGAKNIQELDDQTHDQFIQDNPKAFIMYYATWCGYSKKARKGYGGAAKKMNGKVSFGAVDCDKASTACQGEHPVQGYPTFYLYNDGAWVEEYQEQTTTNAFVTYLNKK